MLSAPAVNPSPVRKLERNVRAVIQDPRHAVTEFVLPSFPDPRDGPLQQRTGRVGAWTESGIERSQCLDTQRVMSLGRLGREGSGSRYDYRDRLEGDEGALSVPAEERGKVTVLSLNIGMEARNCKTRIRHLPHRLSAKRRRGWLSALSMRLNSSQLVRQ